MSRDWQSRSNMEVLFVIPKDRNISLIYIAIDIVVTTASYFTDPYI